MKRLLTKIKMWYEYMKMDKRDISNTFENVTFIGDVSKLNPEKFSNDVYNFINETNKF